MNHRLQVRRAGAAAALVGLSLGCGITASAAVAAPKPTAGGPSGAKIVAPSAGALVTGDSVPVRIAVGRKVTAVKVFAGSKDVSTRFVRQGDRYVARLPRTVLKGGTNALVVQARTGKTAAGGADRSTVILSRRTAGEAMRVSSGEPAAAMLSKTGGYTPTTGAVPVVIRTGRPMFARLTVNGRRVQGLRDRISMQEHSWLLSRRDGLRPGRNAITVEAYDAGGRYAVKRFTVTRDTSLPQVDAGRAEHVTRPGAWVRLDGAQSRARKGRISYAWRVVQAPAGAKPRLRGANSAKPAFKPDRPGMYKLALRATAQRKGVARAAAAGAGPSAEDAVTIAVAPAVTRQGVYLSTALQNPDDPRDFDTLVYGGQMYTSADPKAVDIALQLDAATLAPVASGTAAMITPKDGYVTIYDWLGTTIPGATDKRGSRIYIGTDLVANNTSNQWATDALSDLHGWLQPASPQTGVAKWIPSDYLQVQTRGAHEPATQNTMTINGSPTTVTLPAGAIGGFQAAVLDGRGALIWAPDAYAMTGDATHDSAVEKQLASDLHDWAAKQNVTVLLQGFGSLPSGNGDLGAEVAALGGRAETVILSHTADAHGGVYALIAAPKTAGSDTAEWDAAEASSDRLGGGALSALLTRDPRANHYIVLQSDQSVPDAGRYRFIPQLWAAPTSFANTIRDAGTHQLRPATAGEQAAVAAIAGYAASNQWTVQAPTDPAASDRAARGRPTRSAPPTAALPPPTCRPSPTTSVASRTRRPDWTPPATRRRTSTRRRRA